MIPEHEPHRVQDFALAAGNLDPARHERRQACAARIFRPGNLIRICAHRDSIARAKEQNKNIYPEQSSIPGTANWARARVSAGLMRKDCSDVCMSRKETASSL